MKHQSTLAEHNLAENFIRAFPPQPQTRISWRTIAALLAIGLFFAACWWIGAH